MLVIGDYVHCKLHCDDEIAARTTYSTLTRHTRFCIAFCSRLAAEDFHSFRMASATSSFVQILRLVDWILSGLVALRFYQLQIGVILWMGGWGCCVETVCEASVCRTKFSHVMLKVTEAVTDHTTCDRLSPVWGRGTPLPPCPFTSSSFPLLLFPFFHWLYLFSSFVHPFPFYQNSPTTFPGRRS